LGERETGEKTNGITLGFLKKSGNFSFRFCSRVTASISPSRDRQPPTPGYSKASPGSWAWDPTSACLSRRAGLHPHPTAVLDELESAEGLETFGHSLQMGARGGVHRRDVREEGKEDGGIRDVVAALPAGNGIRIQLQQKLGGVNSEEESSCDMERGGEPGQLPVAAGPSSPSQHFPIKCSQQRPPARGEHLKREPSSPHRSHHHGWLPSTGGS